MNAVRLAPFVIASVVSVIAIPSQAQFTLIDDFNDGNDEGWTHLDPTVGESYGPGTFDASSFAYHLMGAGPVPTGEIGNLAAFWDESVGSQYQNGYLRGTISVTTGNVAYLVLRGNAANGDFYLFGIDPSGESPVFFFNRIEGGEVTRLNGFDISGELVDSGEEWIVQAGAIGNQLSMKAWKPGQPEPAAPQWTGTDSVIASGLLGVGTNHYSPQPPSIVSAAFDDIHFKSVPEPSSVALALLSLTGLLVARYRRE